MSTHHKRYLLIDFENVQNIDLSKADSTIHIIVFVGKNQKTLSIDLAISNQKLGSRLEWRRVDGQGKNALDFYIAYHIGRIFEKDPLAECIIMSKDTGFDALINGLKKDKLNCARVETVAQIKTLPATPPVQKSPPEKQNPQKTKK